MGEGKCDPKNIVVVTISLNNREGRFEIPIIESMNADDVIAPLLRDFGEMAMESLKNIRINGSKTSK